MKRLLLMVAVLACAAAGHAASPKVEPPRQLDKAKVLPLALDDAFQFRKTKTLLNDPEFEKPTIDQMIRFERERINFGAVTSYDKQQRYGHYFTFFWRAGRQADLTIRLEYRQSNLGAYVLAKEQFYPAVKGSVKTDFTVTGDEYKLDGRITGWRVLLIENNKIVALGQSFLWN
jgi:hypothetical protein